MGLKNKQSAEITAIKRIQNIMRDLQPYARRRVFSYAWDTICEECAQEEKAKQEAEMNQKTSALQALNSKPVAPINA